MSRLIYSSGVSLVGRVWPDGYAYWDVLANCPTFGPVSLVSCSNTPDVIGFLLVKNSNLVQIYDF